MADQQPATEPAPVDATFDEARDQQQQPPPQQQQQEEAPQQQQQEDQPDDNQNGAPDCYMSDDLLLTHIKRQSVIVSDSLKDRSKIPLEAGEIALALERELFSPSVPPKRQSNGVCEANPRLNFYPTFMVPETLATYHIFFLNHKIPASCRANRTRADQIFELKRGDTLPTYSPVSEVPKIFEGLGDEEISESALPKEEERESVLVELKGDNPRLAIVKRFSNLTHFAYPALNLPPKVMEVVMNCLIMKKAKGASNLDEVDEDACKPSVTDEELARWLDIPRNATPERAAEIIEDRRKDMMAVTLVTTLLECMRRFFTHPEVIRKMGESIHYAFSHGYVGLASKISNINLSNLVSYMGILHENRLGQSVLHNTLEGEAKRDYIRDTIFLMFIHAWQTGMGVWQQCLEKDNLKELDKILVKQRKALWTGFTEESIAGDLADIIMPEKLLKALQGGLPDLVSQSMMQNFRSFVLERSGILPAVTNALPSDFVPIAYRECPPPLWPYVYLLRLANYMMFHTDVSVNVEGEGLLEYYCRCNLCTPHRCLATNPSMLTETQLIGTFEIQGPKQQEQGEGVSSGLKLSAGMWTSAFLRKFVPEDFHAHRIAFYEDQSKPPAVAPSACVITQESILGQLQDIKKAREEFLLKKGHGVYLDPHTGERLNSPDAPSSVAAPAAHPRLQNHAKSDSNRGGQQRQHGRRSGGGPSKRGGGGCKRLLQRCGGGGLCSRRGAGVSDCRCEGAQKGSFQMGQGEEGLRL